MTKLYKKTEYSLCLFYKTIINNPSDTTVARILIGAQYFINPPKLKFIFSFFKSPIHIIPAKAPRGVKYAPKLDPIIEAYKAPIEALKE